MGLVPLGMWDLNSPTRDLAHVPCIGRQILNHWTTREVPKLITPLIVYKNLGFPSGEVVKDPLAYAEDVGSIPGLGRSPGGGNGNPLQYVCLENPMDRGTWRAAVHGVTKSQTLLSNEAYNDLNQFCLGNEASTKTKKDRVQRASR